MITAINIILCGLGGVGKAFLNLLDERRDLIKSEYGLSLILTAAIDIGGSAITTENRGLDPGMLFDHLSRGRTVEVFKHHGVPGLSGEEAILQSECHVLIEATPTNLVDGEPGMTHVTTALNKGMEVVSANKGPLVLFYRDLHTLAASKNCGLHISAATAAALPALDVGSICLAGTRLLSAEGILNGTTNYILTRMHLEQCSYDEALHSAQEMGIAETDPRLDVEGLDTRNKMILIANRIFGKNFGLKDVPVKGITAITMDEIETAKQNGTVIKLIGECWTEDGTVHLKVGPKPLTVDHPLSTVNFSEKGISYLSDTMGRVTVTGGKSSPVGAAAALLKDLVQAFLFSTGQRM